MRLYGRLHHSLSFSLYRTTLVFYLIRWIICDCVFVIGIDSIDNMHVLSKEKIASVGIIDSGG